MVFPKIQRLKGQRSIYPDHTVWVIILTLAGFLLRIYSLGKSSFWLDEVGVDNIIKSPDLQQVFVQVKAHAMAMPLDYVAGWLVARFCTSDACLRFPSVLWGTLTIPVLYLLIKELSDKRTGLVAGLFLALSSIHVYYAQELRYYEAMLFFSILVIFTFLRAYRTPSVKNWALFMLAAVLGEYTHIYVALSLSFGFFLLLFTGKEDPKLKVKWAGFITSSLFIALLLLPGYLIYSESNHFPEAFDMGRVAVSLLMGSGWLPFQFPSQGLALLWNSVYLLLGGYGLFLVLRHKQRQWLAWIVSSTVSCGLILAADAIWGYWIVPRQFMQLLPLSCGLWAVGFMDLWNRFIIEQVPPLSWRRAIAWILAGLLVIGSLPNLQMTYNNRKGLSREISAAIEESWQPGDDVLVVPQEYPVTYIYYLMKDSRQDISDACKILENPNLASLGPVKTNTFLVTPSNFTTEKGPALVDLGFRRIPVEGEEEGINLPALWVRE